MRRDQTDLPFLGLQLGQKRKDHLALRLGFKCSIRVTIELEGTMGQDQPYLGPPNVKPVL